MEKQTVSLEEVARALGLGRNTVYVAARKGELPLPVIRVGKRLVVPRAALVRMLDGNSLTDEDDRRRGVTAA